MNRQMIKNSTLVFSGGCEATTEITSALTTQSCTSMKATAGLWWALTAIEIQTCNTRTESLEWELPCPWKRHFSLQCITKASYTPSVATIRTTKSSLAAASTTTFTTTSGTTHTLQALNSTKLAVKLRLVYSMKPLFSFLEAITRTKAPWTQ